MAATDSSNRSAMDTLLFKMRRDGKIIRIKRGIYALAQDGGKIGQKERSGIQAIENVGLNSNLSNLTGLTGSVGSALSETAQGEDWGVPT